MAATKIRARSLAIQEIAGRKFSVMYVLTANDLTETTVNTAATYTNDIPTESIIRAVELRLMVPFENTADAAFNSTTVSVGDTGSATRWVNAVECNVNGTEITAPQYSATSVGPYAAAQQFIITVNSMAAKALSSLNKGELHVLVEMFLPKTLDDLQPATAMTK